MANHNTDEFHTRIDDRLGSMSLSRPPCAEKCGNQQGTCGLIFPLFGSESGAWKYKSKGNGKYTFQKKNTPVFRLMLGNVDSEILRSGIRNTAQGIRNPTNDWTSESKFHWQRIQNPVSGIRNRKRGIQNPRLVLDSITRGNVFFDVKGLF